MANALSASFLVRSASFSHLLCFDCISFSLRWEMTWKTIYHSRSDYAASDTRMKNDNCYGTDGLSRPYFLPTQHTYITMEDISVTPLLFEFRSGERYEWCSRNTHGLICFCLIFRCGKNWVTFEYLQRHSFVWQNTLWWFYTYSGTRIQYPKTIQDHINFSRVCHLIIWHLYKLWQRSFVVHLLSASTIRL